jgi:flagellar biosynthetic protein FlhB
MSDTEEKDQKTEEATPRRLDEAREKGQVAISSELMAGLGLCVGFLMLAVGGGQLMRTVGDRIVITVASLASLGTVELTPAHSAALLSDSITSVAGALFAVMMPAILIAALTGYVQVGFRLSPKAIEMDLSKVDLIKGFGRLFSLRAVVRTVMSAAKVGLITVTVGVIAWSHLDSVVRVGISELGPLMIAMGTIAMRCTIGALVVIILLSVVDLMYQRFQHGKDMRMSKQELKEENRLTDGDPHVRSRIRQLQREMATRRMMSDVPKATVVVTNPTHYAVALQYDHDQAAPIVVAKGVDQVAQRIKKIAREHAVVCYEDVPLARALHAQVDIGQEIPEDLFAAVAAVLGYVYRLRGLAVGAAS